MDKYVLIAPFSVFGLLNPHSHFEQALISCANFHSDGFAAGYVGYYLANGCVLMAQFGDRDADLVAFDTVQRLFPDRMIIQITTDGIANGGGTIHCATQQQIAV